MRFSFPASHTTQLINKTVTGALRNKRTVSQHFVMTPSSRKDS